MSNKSVQEKQPCPICFKLYPMEEIEAHANRCIFLNSDLDRPKRKRTPSPNCSLKAVQQNSPKIDVSTDSTSSLIKTTSAANTAKIYSYNNDTLFENNINFVIPLAQQVAPKSLEHFFGQKHILGQNTVLRSLLEKCEIPNIILWGPPGCGKTSLAGIIHEMCKNNPKKYKFVSFCAANCGVKDVQNVVSAAKLEQKFGRQTVLFMDEVHRFNKTQQDTFLSYVEKGCITLIGATTENPSFRINSALLSRCRVVVMEKLDSEDLVSILLRAVNNLNMQVIEDDLCSSFSEGIAIEKSAITWLAETSDGDARIALGSLQLVLQYHNIETGKGKSKIINVNDIESEIKKSHLLYDRKGEEHYNTISAMHKSIRGSDPNAALYWTTRMIVSGEDPLFIARRMVRAASEDIGNADPQALQLAVATMQGCQLLGMPEADVLLAQCAIYLARAPKSREADSALAAAKKVIAECKGVQPPVPMHIRNAPTKLMKDLGYGRLQKGAKRTFMPAGMDHVDFFKS